MKKEYKVTCFTSDGKAESYTYEDDDFDLDEPIGFFAKLKAKIREEKAFMWARKKNRNIVSDADNIPQLEKLTVLKNGEDIVDIKMGE